MRGPVTSGFLYDIEDAVLAWIMSEMGVGTTTYPEYPYLQLAYAGRVSGAPQMDVPPKYMPAIFLQYVGGGDETYEIGSVGEAPDEIIEVWNIYGVLQLKAEDMDLPVDTSDFLQTQAFLAAINAGAGLFLYRLLSTFSGMSLSVSDSLLGYVTNGHRVDAWANHKVPMSLTEIKITTLTRLTVKGER